MLLLTFQMFPICGELDDLMPRRVQQYFKVRFYLVCQKLQYQFRTVRTAWQKTYAFVQVVNMASLWF